MFHFTSHRGLDPQFRRRTRFLTTLVSIVFLLLGGRLFFLQVLQGERFAYLAENNRIRLKKIPGTRGMVLDRNGQLLVDSRPSFDLLFVPEDATEPKISLRHLARFLGREEREFLKLFKKSKGKPPFEEIVLDRKSVV